MEETLKTTRLLYHTVMLLCVAVFLFVLSVGDTDRYERAIAALSKIANTDLQEFPKFQLRMLKRSSVFGEMRGAFAAAFKKNGVLYSDQKIEDTLLFSVPTWLAKAPKGSAPLSDVDKFLRDNYSRKALALILSKDSLMAEVSNALATGEEIKCFVDLTFDHTLTDEQAGGQTITGLVGYLQISHNNSCGTPVAYLQISLSGEVQAIPNSSVQDWLQSDMKDQQDVFLASNDDGASVIPLPDIKEYWNEIRGKSLTDALVALEQKKAETSGSINAGGISVPERLVYWAAPVIIAVLLWYLQFHLRHLIRLCDKEPQPLLAEFPWAPLFPGAMGALVAATLIGVPGLAVVPLAVLRSHYHSTVWYLVPVFVLFTILLGIWCLRLTFILRSRVTAPKEAAVAQEDWTD